jgi:hypothetical protein
LSITGDMDEQKTPKFMPTCHINAYISRGLKKAHRTNIITYLKSKVCSVYGREPVINGSTAATNHGQVIDDEWRLGGLKQHTPNGYTIEINAGNYEYTANDIRVRNSNAICLQRLNIRIQPARDRNSTEIKRLERRRRKGGREEGRKGEEERSVKNEQEEDGEGTEVCGTAA